MNGRWTNYGAQKFVEAFNDGADLTASANAMIGHWNSSGRPGEIFCGWVGWAVTHLVAFRRQTGATFDDAYACFNDDGEEIVLRVNAAFRTNRIDDVFRDVSMLCRALAFLRARPGQNLRAAPPEDDALAVKVVAMPVRVSHTEVERDGAGNINKTTQVQSDGK